MGSGQGPGALRESMECGVDGLTLLCSFGSEKVLVSPVWGDRAVGSRLDCEDGGGASACLPVMDCGGWLLSLPLLDLG